MTATLAEPLPKHQTPPFEKTWTAQLLNQPPLIAPARQFTYPHPVPGEEDALARGALLLNVKPAGAPNFLATCALGFRDPSLPTGVFPCPRPDELLAVAGGYAYVINTQEPKACVHLAMRPVTQVLSVPSHGLILLAGFHEILALDADGVRWTTARLSWEGVAMNEVVGDELHGMGWNLHTDRERPFTVDLATGSHTGGGVLP